MKYWIVPANTTRFRLHDYLADFDAIDWDQKNYHYEVGDVVFLYCSMPEQRIRYMMRVVGINVPKEQQIDDRAYSSRSGSAEADDTQKVFRMQTLKAIDTDRLTLATLQQNGLTSIPQSPRSLTGEVLDYVLSVFEGVNDDNLDYEILEHADEIFEGAKKTIVVNRYERNSAARRQCIERHGCKCSVCGLDFEKMYGELGRGFIHVHHIVPISTIGQEYKLDPVKDLVPVCPNCHAMLHHGAEGRVLSIEELQARLRR